MFLHAVSCVQHVFFLLLLFLLTDGTVVSCTLLSVVYRRQIFDSLTYLDALDEDGAMTSNNNFTLY